VRRRPRRADPGPPGPDPVLFPLLLPPQLHPSHSSCICQTPPPPPCRRARSDKTLPYRDPNGHRQLILVLTSGGRLAALHNGDGRVLWARQYAPGAAPQLLLRWRTFHDLTHAPQARHTGGGGAGGCPVCSCTAEAKGGVCC
jgi:hypothetical protein